MGRARRYFSSFLAVAAGVCSPESGAAQTLVRGTVTGDGRPLPRATVLIGTRGLQTETNEKGGFALVVSEAGIVRIVVRAIGYYPASRNLLLESGVSDTVTADFQLERAPQQLDSITVEGSKTAVVGKMQAFEERRAAGFGVFFTREVLAAREHSTLADVLRTTAGLNLIRRPAECGGGYALATGRGNGAFEHQPWMVCYSWPYPFPNACYLAIYLDGTRLWAPPQLEPPDINQFDVSLLEGIEVYRGPSEAPMRYQITGSACGVALLWTRVGER